MAVFDSSTEGFVFDIKRFALHDGPGIRTTVFLLGCPLRCSWCQNPESQGREPRIFYNPARCRACRTCEATCPTGAISFAGSVRQRVAARCSKCGRCAKVCPQRALALIGRQMTASDVWQAVRRDGSFYANSGGGVTLSGGEPLAQPMFAGAILELCHTHGVHTALDTTAYAPWAALRGLLPYVDTVLLDLKSLDPARHRQLTNVDNRLILANAGRLASSGVELVVRVPIIPGQTDDEAGLQALPIFLAGLPGAGRVELLPYNRMAESKYASLGLRYGLQGLAAPSAERMAAIKDLVSLSGWPVAVVWGLGI
jgi:pyruvate formate lyase activating enzyme